MQWQTDKMKMGEKIKSWKKKKKSLKVMLIFSNLDSGILLNISTPYIFIDMYGEISSSGKMVVILIFPS